MAISIKNAETDALIRELAELTGTTQSDAVATAVRERLNRLRQETKPPLAERLLAIGADSASRMSDEHRTASYDDLLYDEDGLPR